MRQDNPPASTRTSGTERTYLAEGNRLRGRYEREAQQAAVADPVAFVRWLGAQRPGVTPATWRVRKASVMHLCREMGWTHAMEELQLMTSDGCAPRTATRRRTSAGKSKSISPNDLATLTRELAQNRTAPWVSETLLWFKATILVGLRPSEWTGAELVEAVELADGTRQQGLFLRVKNAKATNGRAHGEFRHLDLANLDGTGRRLVETQLARTRQCRGPDGSAIPFPEYYEGCRTCLYRWTRSVLGRGRKRYPTLYTARHQFRADHAARGRSLGEIAQMMGHAVDDTNMEHYGRKRNGSAERAVVEPFEPEVARVRVVANVKGPTGPG